MASMEALAPRRGQVGMKPADSLDFGGDLRFGHHRLFIAEDDPQLAKLLEYRPAGRVRRSIHQAVAVGGPFPWVDCDHTRLASSRAQLGPRNLVPRIAQPTTENYDAGGFLFVSARSGNKRRTGGENGTLQSLRC